MYTESRADKIDHGSASEIFDVVFDFDLLNPAKSEVHPFFAEVDKMLFGSPELIDTSEPAPEITASIAELSKSDKPIDKALAEALRGIFSNDSTDADTTKERDANIILKLIERDKPPLDKEALLQLVKKATYCNGRHAVLELAESEKSPKVVETLATLLKSKEPKDIQAGDSLIFLLSNTQPRNQEMSEQVVKMLSGTSNDRDLVLELLTGPLRLDQLGKMLTVLNLASDAEIKEVRSLLKSTDEKDVDSAVGLIELAGQDYCLFSRALSSERGEERQRTLDIVRNVETADDIELLLNLSSEPRNHKSIDALLLKPEVAKTTLQLLGSAFAEDKTFGQRIFERLGKDAQSAKDVVDILSFDDEKMSQRLLTLLERPSTADGIRTLLSQRESNNRKDRYDATNMLSFILGDDLKNSEHLVAILQRDKSLATRLFHCADNSLIFQPAQRLLSSTEERHRKIGVGIVNLANAGPDGKTAAEFFVNLVYSDIDLYESMATKFAATKSDELTEIATAMVNTSTRAGALTLIRILNSPDKSDAPKQIIHTLLKGNSEEQAITRTLLNSFGPEKERHPNGVFLEKMLNNPQEKALAKAILASVDDSRFDSRLTVAKLLPLYSAPEDVPLRQQMNKIAENDPALAKALIRADFTRGELGTFLEIYGESERATVATVLRQMMVDNENVKRFLKMLDPASPDSHRIGFSLLSMLNKPTKDLNLNPATAPKDAHRIHANQPLERSIARHLLASNLSDETLMRAKNAMQNGSEEELHLAKHFLNLAVAHPLAKDSLNKIYNGIHSTDTNVKNSSLLMLKFLDQQSSAAIELFKHIGPKDPEFSKIAQIADTPEKMKAVVEIFRMRNQPTEAADPNEPPPKDPSVAASALIELMGRPATAGDAKFVIDMLASKQSHDRAISLILAFGTRRDSVTQLIPLLNPNPDASPEQKMRAQRLNHLLNNPTQANIQAIENLANVLTAPFVEDKSKTAIKEMLCDAQQADSALKVLKMFSSPEACERMLAVMLDPKEADVKNAIEDILTSGRAIDITRVEGFLSALGGPGVGTSSFLLPLLRDVNSREFAKLLIQSADRFDYITLQTMMQNKRDAEILTDLMKIAGSNSDFRKNAPLLLNNGLEDIRSMHSVLKNDDTKDIGFKILDLLSSNEAPEIIMGRLSLNRMATGTGQTADYTRQLLQRFRATDNDAEQTILLGLASINTADAIKLDEKLNQPGMDVARKLAGEIGLARLQQFLLENPDDADRFWRMMNDSHQHKRLRAKLQIEQP